MRFDSTPRGKTMHTYSATWMEPADQAKAQAALVELKGLERMTKAQLCAFIAAAKPGGVDYSRGRWTKGELVAIAHSHQMVAWFPHHNPSK